MDVTDNKLGYKRKILSEKILKIATLNVRGLGIKEEELSLKLTDRKVNIAVITETKKT